MNSAASDVYGVEEQLIIFNLPNTKDDITHLVLSRLVR